MRKLEIILCIVLFPIGILAEEGNPSGIGGTEADFFITSNIPFSQMPADEMAQANPKNNDVELINSSYSINGNQPSMAKGLDKKTKLILAAEERADAWLGIHQKSKKSQIHDSSK